VTEDQNEPFAADPVTPDLTDDVDLDHSGDRVDAEEFPDTAPTAERTGHEAVDSVLQSLDALSGAPVAEHVAVFEAAHDRLRGTLATAGDSTPSPQG
jgi:hypothetical protein